MRRELVAVAVVVEPQVVLVACPEVDDLGVREERDVHRVVGMVVAQEDVGHRLRADPQRGQRVEDEAAPGDHPGIGHDDRVAVADEADAAADPVAGVAGVEDVDAGHGAMVRGRGLARWAAARRELRRVHAPMPPESTERRSSLVVVGLVDDRLRDPAGRDAGPVPDLRRGEVHRDRAQRPGRDSGRGPCSARSSSPILPPGRRRSSLPRGRFGSRRAELGPGPRTRSPRSCSSRSRDSSAGGSARSSARSPSSALVAFTYLHDLTRTARLDVPVAALVLLYLVVGLEAVRRGSVRWSIAAGLCFAVAFLVKEVALPFAPVPHPGRAAPRPAAAPASPGPVAGCC